MTIAAEEGMVSALTRIAEALERISPPPMPAPRFDAAEAYVWRVSPDRLDPARAVSRVPLELLVGVDRSRETLLENTRRFARGLPANNALLWGARGMGKSSLVKAVHAAVNAEGEGEVKLVEIQRDHRAGHGTQDRLRLRTLRRQLRYALRQRTQRLLER